MKTKRVFKTLTKEGVKFNKRKRGLMKKSMEISLQCKKNVCLVIYDPVKDQTLVYSSRRFKAGFHQVREVVE